MDHITNFVDSLDNTYINFPDNFTIWIIVENGVVQNNSTFDGDPEEDCNNDIDDIKQTEMNNVDDHNTETTEKDDHRPNETEPK